MGVQGLWQLLESTGRPVTLESLEGKVLAVDVSLWLHQAMRGMRDEQGNVAANAHLQVLFNRICKLLFYRIKPVFVFDGGVPQLKKQTMVARRQRREVASSNLKKAVDKVLTNYMKQHALKAVVGCASELPEPPTRVPFQRSNKPHEPDIFELPPMPESSEQRQGDDEEEDEDEETEDIWAESQHHLSEFATEDTVEATDIDSDVFRALPLEVQHELITVMKEKGKSSSWKKISQLPKQAGDFSNYQLSKLLNKGKMTQRLGQLRKEMTVRNTGAVASFLDHENAIEELQAGRIMSEDREHYVLVKNKPSEKKSEEVSSSRTSHNEASSSGTKQGTSSSTKLEDEPLEENKESASEVKVQENKTSWDIDLTETDDSFHVYPDKSKEITDAVKSFFAKNNLQANSGTITEIQGAGSAESTNHSEKSAKIEITTISESESKKEDVEIVSNSASQSADNVEIVDAKSGARTKNMQSLLTTALDQIIITQLTGSNKEGDTSSVNEVVSEDVVSSKRQDEEQVADEEKAASDDGTSDDIMIVGEVQGSPTTSRKQTAKMPKPPAGKGHMPGPFSFMSSLMDKLITSALSDNLEVSDDVLAKKKVLSKENGSKGKPDVVETVEDSSDESDDDFIDVPIHSVNDLPEEANLQISTSSVKEVDLEPESPRPTGLKDATDDVVAVEEEGVDDEEDAEDVEVVMEEKESDGDDEKEDTLDDDKDDIAMETRHEESQEIQRQNAVEEWAGMNVDNRAQLQEDLESERRSLATERHKQERVAASITDVMYAESKELLQLFGIPFIVSPQEAEAQCAYLDITKQTQGTITDDSDVWLFGGRFVYKNFFTKGKDVEFFRTLHLEKQLVLTRDKLIQLAYLLGSDYTVGVQGVGGITAMELLSEFPGQGLEGLKKFKEWWDTAQKQLKPPSESAVKAKLRKVTINPGFPNPHVMEAYLQPVVDESKEKFTWGSPDLDLLREFATAKLGWNRSKVDEMLLPMLRKHNETQSQTKINHFFPTELSEPRPIKSKRLQRVLKRFHDSKTEPEDEKIKKWKTADGGNDDDYTPSSAVQKGEQAEVRRSGRVSRKVIPSVEKTKRKKHKTDKKDDKETDVQSNIPSEATSARDVQVIDGRNRNTGSNGAMDIKDKSKSSTRGDTGKGERRGKGRVGVKGKGKLLAKNKGRGNVKISKPSGPKLSESSENDSD